VISLFSSFNAVSQNGSGKNPPTLPLNGLLVMKFGGTSMGGAERMRATAAIIASHGAQRRLVVVVSAMSTVTDLLVETLRRAELGDRAAVDLNIRRLFDQHLETCEDLFQEVGGAAKQEASKAVELLVSEFRRVADGIIILRERPPRCVDEALAIGERLSSTLLAHYLVRIGVDACPTNGSHVIVTDAVFGNACPHMEPTRIRCAERLLPLLESGTIPIVTGFNGATADGHPTTLGRGGSDFSASIIAAAMDADELWIWSDVDGIMTADPRLVRDVAVIEELTYAEAAELARNGAKILHPRTLTPLLENQIPVWSKNSFAPEKSGSKIVSRVKEPGAVRAVTSMSNVVLISMEPANAALSGTRLMARALDALALSNVEILAFTSSSYRQSFCFLIRKHDLMTALKALEGNLCLELAHGYLKTIDVDENVGFIAVVGEGMRGTPGLAGRVFSAIASENINIMAIAQGSSELTIGIIVQLDGLERAVRAVHEQVIQRKCQHQHLSPDAWPGSGAFVNSHSPLNGDVPGGANGRRQFEARKGAVLALSLPQNPFVESDDKSFAAAPPPNEMQTFDR
jgi:bifunctional aspartokinase / homoserine dehydrogenase 1